MTQSLKKRIEENIKEALKAGETQKISVLRMVNAAIHNREIQLLRKDQGLSDEEVLEVIRSEVKKRRDSVEEFTKGNRPELAAKEQKEMEILSVYLPPELSDEELERILKDGIRETGAKNKADFGKVMKVSMPVLKGKASGERVSAILNRLLGPALLDK